MKTYKDIDEFIIEAFPMEYEILSKRKKSAMEMDVEHIDSIFLQEVEKAIKGEKEQKGSKTPTANNA